MIDFKSFFDFTKLPTKIFVVVALASGVFLFAPVSITKLLHFEKFNKYAGYVGLLFVFCIVFVVVNFVIWVFQKVEFRINLKKLKKEYQNTLSSLDSKEKAVLREFAIQGQHSVKMPYDDTVVSGLIDKGILKFNKQLGNSFIANGNKVSLSLSKYISEIITPEHLDLSLTLTEEEKYVIEENRPEWTNDWRY